MYFALISIGITSSVNIYYAFYLTIVLITVIVIIFLFDRYNLKKGKKIHNLSLKKEAIYTQ